MKSRRNEENPWLDDVGFKDLVRKKGKLYSRKEREDWLKCIGKLMQRGA